MKAKAWAALATGLLSGSLLAGDSFPILAAQRLPSPDPDVTLWWALSSASKIRPDTGAPSEAGAALTIRCARNERDAAQLVVRSERPLQAFQIECGELSGPADAKPGEVTVEILRVEYLAITQATDRSAQPGLWPDPLPPFAGPVDLEADRNHAFWIRVAVPPTAPAGLYRATLRMKSGAWQASAPLELTVYDFALPNRMTCVSAFGFSPGSVFRYHGLKTDAQKREVLAKYWENLAAHHISPYDPAPLDQFQVHWPEVRPPQTAWDHWSNLQIVSNEVHQGQGALLIYDDKTDENVTVAYGPMIRIPEKGLRVRCWYRTAIPGHRFIVTLNHFDANQQWMSGRNNDMTLVGSGYWQGIDELLTSFPAGAEYVRFNARATTWSDAGEQTGLVWFDDISITDAGTGKELIEGGDFERRRRAQPVAPAEQLQARFDFAAWDRAMSQAIDQYHFNSFRLPMAGMGGGTFHSFVQPELLGFGEDTPEYPILFDSYGRQLQAHLREKGWLDEAFVYWFDEPSPDQYAFVLNGFAKLKRACPDIARMLTEQVEPGLIGGPNIWCPISNNYDPKQAEERRRHGETFWWYVCTGPKTPYTGLFIDHAAPEMRLWLWQTFQRNIAGILVWQLNYWTSGAAYPDADQPQNPYADPMSWTSGYSTPAGMRRPWGNGDGRFIYPPKAAASGNPSAPVIEGPVDSIRWEHLRDGVEDYEYLCILRQHLEAARPKLSAADQARYAALLEVPETITRSLTDFAADGAGMETRRHEVAQAIEQLQRHAR